MTMAASSWPPACRAEPRLMWAETSSGLRRMASRHSAMAAFGSRSLHVLAIRKPIDEAAELERGKRWADRECVTARCTAPPRMVRVLFDGSDRLDPESILAFPKGS